MDNGTSRPVVESQIKQLARDQAKAVLRDSHAFHGMDLADQQSIYLSLVQEYSDKEKEKRGLAVSMADETPKVANFKGHDPGFGQDTKAFNELVESVDFPDFVADLLKAVFDANIKVMKQQTDSYIALMKEATKSSADFIKQVKDEESFARLAESRSDQYNVVTENAPDGTSKLTLTNPQGDKVDPDDAEVKKHIMDTKIAMAKEHRAALREVLLMGVTRLVVKKGLVEAGVDFTVTANREAKAHHDDKNISTFNYNESVNSPFGGLGGGINTGKSVNNTNIQVNTSDAKADDHMGAKLHGKVQIEFETDYFKLDNFANMYGDGGTAALKGGEGPAALPAGR
jgi:hypothetical protein